LKGSLWKYSGAKFDSPGPSGGADSKIRLKGQISG